MRGVRWDCLVTSDGLWGSDEVVLWWHRTIKEILMRLLGDIGPPRRVWWDCLVTSDGLGGSDEVVWWHRTTKEVPMRLLGDIGPPRRVWWDCLVTSDGLGWSDEVVWWHWTNNGGSDMMLFGGGSDEVDCCHGPPRRPVGLLVVLQRTQWRSRFVYFRCWLYTNRESTFDPADDNLQLFQVMNIFLYLGASVFVVAL
jgi:hypothetical protein